MCLCVLSVRANCASASRRPTTFGTFWCGARASFLFIWRFPLVSPRTPLEIFRTNIYINLHTNFVCFAAAAVYNLLILCVCLNLNCLVHQIPACASIYERHSTRWSNSFAARFGRRSRARRGHHVHISRRTCAWCAMKLRCCGLTKIACSRAMATRRDTRTHTDTNTQSPRGWRLNE